MIMRFYVMLSLDTVKARKVDIYSSDIEGLVDRKLSIIS